MCMHYWQYEEFIHFLPDVSIFDNICIFTSVFIKRDTWASRRGTGTEVIVVIRNIFTKINIDSISSTTNKYEY
jgi:hypothetical protein